VSSGFRDRPFFRVRPMPFPKIPATTDRGSGSLRPHLAGLKLPEPSINILPICLLVSGKLMWVAKAPPRGLSAGGFFYAL
jgi:hypothetical protein